MSCPCNSPHHCFAFPNIFTRHSELPHVLADQNPTGHAHFTFATLFFLRELSFLQQAHKLQSSMLMPHRSIENILFATAGRQSHKIEKFIYREQPAPDVANRGLTSGADYRHAYCRVRCILNRVRALYLQCRCVSEVGTEPLAAHILA